MNFINNIFSFLKNLFSNKNKVKLIDSPTEPIIKQDNSNFINSLKVNVPKNKNKKKIETLTCVGDGLGIQNNKHY